LPSERSREFIEREHLVCTCRDFFERRRARRCDHRLSRGRYLVEHVLWRAVCDPFRRDFFMDLFLRVDDQRGVHLPAPFSKDFERVLTRELGSIGSVRCQRVETVYDRQNPRPDWDCGAPQTCRIPGTIPILMVMSHNWYDRIRKIDGRKDIGTHAG